MRNPSILVLIAVALLSGCSKSATDPGSGTTGPPPPALVASQPAPRSTGVLYDTEIWGQFDRPLDAASIGTKSVFLKLDGQRIPVLVSYESVTQRIYLKPTVTLQLQRTYTVDFSTSVEGTDGAALPDGVYFQFTTNSLRRPAYDYPVSGQLEGPLVTLGWGGTQGPANELFYEVYAGTDSLAVVSRNVPVLQRSVFTRFLPSQAWPAGQRVYWAITSEHAVSHERLHGPVQSFRVMSASVPIESTQIFARDYGSSDIRNRNTQYCARTTLPIGPNFNGSIHWDFSRLPTDARVVSATMTAQFPDAEIGRFNGVKPITMWMTQNEWVNCSIVAPGPPYNEPSGLLASGVDQSPLIVAFSSARFGAFAEAMARARTLLSGVTFRSTDNFNFHAPGGLDPNLIPRVTVQYQRLSAASTP